MRFRNGLSLWLSPFFFCAVAACDGGSKATAPALQPAKTAPGPSYESELRKLGEAIDHGIALGARQSGDTLIPLEVVALYLERARLTGDYDDYARAATLLESLPGGQSPSAPLCLARARLHYTLHRLKRASAALDECPPTVEATEVAALRGDIAMYSGRYREAEATYRALVNQSGTPQQYVRLALLRNRTGAPGEAVALLEAAEKRYHGGAPTMKAWLKLQRGLVALDRGRLEEALAMYRLGSDALAGWWLMDEHIAEALQLSGNAPEAKRIYVSVVERTRAPEFMDALAAIERQEGNGDKAGKLLQQSRALYEQRLAAFPEAAAGHALDHFLQDPSDAKRALALAQKNFEARPYGESAVAWAKAWLLAGKPERAAALIEAQLAQGWDTAEAHWILGEGRRKMGRHAGADQARAEALRRNPLSEKMYAFSP